MARCEPLVVGVDIGTSSTKAVIFDGEGRVRGHHAAGYPLHMPIPGVAEQDPEEIYAACVVAISAAVRTCGIDARSVRCVGFGAAMHSLTPSTAKASR